MRKRVVSMFLALSLLIGCGAALAESAPSYDIPMRDLAARYGFKLGAPLSFWDLQNRSYLTVLSGTFNSLTATNEMKAYSLLNEAASRAAEDGMPVMNYQSADAMVAWAQENGIGVRGHVLVWDAYMSDWFFHEDYDPAKPYADSETMRARTRYYIHEVMTHFENAFPGVVYCWDVVNEAVADGPDEYAEGDPRHLRTLRSGTVNLFREYLGDDYVPFAFKCAYETREELGADIRLYYNDYNAYFPEKAEAILNLMETVNTYVTDENGEYVRLADGIGMQGYIGGYGHQEGCLEESHIGMIRDAILGYAAAGFEVQITEMAVRNFERDPAARPAPHYADLFALFAGLYDGATNPLCAVSIWGLTDNPYAQPGTYNYNLNSPYGGLYNERYGRKDAWKMVYAVLSGAAAEEAEE